MRFKCGLIGHHLFTCPLLPNGISNEDRNNLEYGPWIGAKNYAAYLLMYVALDEEENIFRQSLFIAHGALKISDKRPVGHPISDRNYGGHKKLNNANETKKHSHGSTTSVSKRTTEREV